MLMPWRHALYSKNWKSQPWTTDTFSLTFYIVTHPNADGTVPACDRRTEEVTPYTTVDNVGR